MCICACLNQASHGQYAVVELLPEVKVGAQCPESAALLMFHIPVQALVASKRAVIQLTGQVKSLKKGYAIHIVIYVTASI